MDNLLFYHTKTAMTDKIKIFIKFNISQIFIIFPHDTYKVFLEK